MTSVTTALPFLKSSPPTAGRSAKARGAEFQFELSWSPERLILSTFGRRRSSVDVLTSSSEKSERIELRRWMPANGGSGKVFVRPSGRIRIFELLSPTGFLLELVPAALLRGVDLSSAIDVTCDR